MPMYEKGSVRAGPRSKQQERMKKIMKKFLSSLLALTMILSLVIVPANAADSITATASSIKVGETTTLTAFDKPTEVTVEGTKYTVTSDAPTYNWTSGTPAHATVPDDGHTSNTVVVTGVAAGNSVITCTMTVSYTIPAHDQVAENTAQTTVSDTYTVTVTDPQVAFEAAVKQATVTFKGRTYPANSGTTTFAIDLFGSETLPTSGTDMPTISVSDPYKSTTLVYDTTNSKWVAQYGTGGSALSCDVTLNATKVSPDPTVSISNNLPVNTKAISGQKVSLTADYSRKAPGKNITYAWSASNGAEISGNGASATWTPKSAGTNQTVTVIVYEGESEAARYAATYDLMPTTTKSRLSITRPLTRFRALLLSRFPLLHFTTRPLATA